MREMSFFTEETKERDSLSRLHKAKHSELCHDFSPRREQPRGRASWGAAAVSC